MSPWIVNEVDEKDVEGNTLPDYIVTCLNHYGPFRTATAADEFVQVMYARFPRTQLWFEVQKLIAPADADDGSPMSPVPEKAKG